MNLGTVTVNPSPTPVPAANFVITLVTFNGLNGTISSDGKSATFANSGITVGDHTNLTIKVTNIGNAASMIGYPAVVSGTEDSGVTVLNFHTGYTTKPPNMMIAPGQSYWFEWLDIEAVNAGTVSPTITITPP